MNLKEIRLPAGDVGSIAIGWPSSAGESIRLDPATWLSQGYDGVRLIGEGIGRTQLHCTSHDGITLKVGRHEGIVQLEEVTLVPGASRAALIGAPDKTRPIARKFKFGFKRAYAYAPMPSPNATGRPAWLFHLYQVDDDFEDVELDGTFLSEHPYYGHGHSKTGSRWKRVKVRGSGAENDKVRSDASETLWAGKNVWIVREDVEYHNWYQRHSSRGGAASVRQGVGANCAWYRCLAYGGGDLDGVPGHLRSRTIMVTSEENSYDATTGEVDKQGGHGTGQVIISQCGIATTSPGTENISLLARVGRVSGQMHAAKSVLVEQSGLFGQRMQLQLGEIPAGKTRVRGCNTPAIRAYCEARGLDTRHEAVITLADRMLPISEGFAR